VEERFHDHGNILNNLAWSLIMERAQPESYAYAVRLAKRAVELEDTYEFWNTLAAARYYVGEYEAAIASGHESMGLGGFNSVDGLILAMAHHALGNTDEAEEWFERTLAHLRDNPTLDPEILRFREEARRVFGR
jgi:tetratricopeptide (TPR) repeat protein